MTSPVSFQLNNEIVDMRGQDSVIDDVSSGNICLDTNSSLHENPAFGGRLIVSRSREYFIVVQGVTELVSHTPGEKCDA